MASDNECTTLYYCVTQARCRLCQFALVEGQLVVAATDDNKVSCKFPFQQHTTFYDHEIDIKFHMCMRRECMFRDKPTVLFHGHCYAFRVHLVTPKFLAATQYAFAPSVAEERRRADYIQKALSLNLQRALVWPRRLPHELWLMVAEPLAQACATLTAQEQVEGSVDVEDYTLDLMQSVYASYVKIDGRCYVKSLQNTPGVSGGKGKYLLQPAQNPKEESNNMFVAEDHLGIRQVVFVPPKCCLEWCRNHPAVLGTWWRHISYKAIPSAVIFRSDGLKMRNVESPQTDSISLIGWQAPVHPAPPVIDLLTLEKPQQYPDGLRMRFCDLNTADVVGYSVATDGAKVLAILSHKQNDQPDSALYEDVSAEICHWMYMPMNEGEYLTEICRRARCFVIQTQVVGITFSTNQGRTVLFGLYGHENVEYRRVTALPRGPSRLYFNQLDPSAGKYGVDFVAFEQPNPDSPNVIQDNLPMPPVSISDYPNSLANEVWMHTSCSMRHLTEVYTCIKRTLPHRPVIGMLLCYSDGHRECVGQFRQDWVAEPTLVGEMDTLYICGRRTKKNWGYVAEVTCLVPVSRTETDRWLDVRKSGTLEWWFSSRHSVLFYDNTRLN